MDSSINKALAEAYATAPEVLVAHTLEFRHPSFLDDEGKRMGVRVVRGYDNYKGKLEATAPLNAGQTVEFMAMAFNITLPQSDASAKPTLTIEMDNVGREILKHIEASTETLDKIEVTYRPFIWDEHQAPAQNPVMTFEIKSIEVTFGKIKAVAGLPDLGSKSFPSDVFTLANYPALAR